MGLEDNDNDENGCPGSVPLDSPPIQFDIKLYDDFHTMVTGPYLTDKPFWVTLEYNIPVGTLSTNNMTQEISSSSGKAEPRLTVSPNF